MWPPRVRQRLDLVRHLVARDFRLRYHGSLLGVLWSVLLPLTQLLVLVFLFQRVVPLGIEGYPAFVYSGLLPWTWFSSSLAAAGGVFVGNRDLIRRPDFPSGLLVLVNVMANLLVYLVSLPLLLALLWVYGRPPGAALAIVPLLLLVQAMLLVGLGLAVATVNVFYRDVQHLVTVGLSLLFYLTPVFYRADQAGAAALVVLRLNPMATLVTAHRAVCLENVVPPLATLASMTATAALALALGWVVHRAHIAEVVDRL